MTTESSGNAKSIFIAASEIDSSEAREAYLRSECGADTALRRRVDALLIAHERPESLLDQPPRTAAAGTLNRTVDYRPTTIGAGEAIGPYRLREQIGEGGMGSVYVAQQDKPLRRTVALKVIKPGMDSGSVIARFEAERQALALMDHPNIAKVLDAGTTDQGRPYFVMELVRGAPITQYCDEHKLSIRERLELFMQVASAIKHAHQKGIIHRDIKPSNVLVAEHDDKAIPKVIDFGIAKAIGQSLTDRTIDTGFHSVVGTPLYMSPEQAASNVDVDTRSDVYSLGVLLYELLTGTTPFGKETLKQAAQDEVLRIIREQEPPKPSTRVGLLSKEQLAMTQSRSGVASLRRSLRGELDWIVMRALQKDRSRRYETTSQFAEDIENYLNGRAVIAGPPSAWYQLKKTVARHRAVAAGVLLAIGVLATIALVLRWKNIELATALAATERAESETSSINDFFINGLLGQADPELNPYQEKTTVLEFLDRAAEEMAGSAAFNKHPEVAATVRLVIGRTYFALGQWQRALEHLEPALAIRREELGPRDPKTLEALAALLDLQAAMEDFDAALESALVLEDAWRELRGGGDQNCLRARINQSMVLMFTGRYSEAESLANDALREAEHELGDRDDVTMNARQAVADILSTQFKEFDRARTLYENNLAVLRDKGHKEHSHEVLTVRLRLIEHLMIEGRTSEAELQAAEILRTRSTLTLPDGHPHTILARIGLGVAQEALGKYSEAARNLRAAYAQAAENLGQDHATTWLARHALVMAGMQNFVVSPNRQEIADEAEQLALRNVEVGRLKQWPEDHSSAHQNQTDLATALLLKGVANKTIFSNPTEFGQAKEILEKLYASSKQHRGAAHPLTLGSGMHLVQMRLVVGEDRQELEQFLGELRSTTQQVPEGLPVRANLAQALGTVLADRGRLADAEPLLREYLEFCQRSENVSQLDRTSACTGLLECLRKQGREKPVGAVDLERDRVHRITIRRPSAMPIVTVRTGFFSTQTGFENYSADESFLFVAADGTDSATVSWVPLAADPPPGTELPGETELIVQPCDLTKDETIEGNLEVGQTPGLPVNNFPFATNKLAMKAGCWYRIEATGKAFRPNLWLENSEGKLLKWTVDRLAAAAKLDYSPPADGEFSIIVFPTKRNTDGEFTLAIREYTPKPASP